MAKLPEFEEFITSVGEKVLDKTYYHGLTIREWADKIINDAPTADAEPVKHGRWIYGENEDGQDGIFCSECDHFVPWYYDYYDKTDDLINDNPRCPNCGARMDGGKIDRPEHRARTARKHTGGF